MIKAKEPSSAGLPKDFDKALIDEVKGITGATTEEEVIEALAICEGNKENAINYIMNQKHVHHLQLLEDYVFWQIDIFDLISLHRRCSELA